MNFIESYVGRGQALLRRLALRPGFHYGLRAGACVLGGFLFSAASLGHQPLPLGAALIWALSGWSAVLCSVGSVLGYILFWGQAGYQPVLWVLASVPGALLLSGKRISRESPLLIPAAAALVIAASGVAFQVFFGDMTSIPMYILRVSLGAGSAWLLARLLTGRDPVVQWVCLALGVLALAQIAPIPWLCLGFLGAGMLQSAGAFPAAALGGLALDLAQVSPVPMTAVMTLSYLVRLLPRQKKWLTVCAPAFVYLGIMSLRGVWDFTPLPALIIGSFSGLFLPVPGKQPRRMGETGIAQVRLEIAAGVMARSEQLLLEFPDEPVDEEALIIRAADFACGGCSYRKNCPQTHRIVNTPTAVLYKPLLSPQELPVVCRKSGRFLAQLHRAQEQLRSIRADRQRQKEYRAALTQQYRFMAEFLQDLSDRLSTRPQEYRQLYEPRLSVFGNKPEGDNGDRCMGFAGTGSRYYLLLCDGMGTGLGAVAEGKSAAELLKGLLTAGYPAQHALQTLNSMCALRERAGAVTVDLAEIMLDTGRVNLYKWGAPASYLVTEIGAERIGFAGPPPGLAVQQLQERTERFSLRRGEWLVLVSDGISEADALRFCRTDQTPREMAAKMLSASRGSGQDDATVAVFRLEN